VTDAKVMTFAASNVLSDGTTEELEELGSSSVDRSLFFKNLRRTT
jgi:hypothetical protein